MWALAEIDPVVARHGEWIGGGTIELSVTAKNGETLTRQSVTFGGGEHSASIDLGDIATADGEVVVHASARPAGGGRQNYGEALALDSLSWPGRPLVYRRGPATAMSYVPTASLDFNRTERIRVDLPLAEAPAAPAARVAQSVGAADVDSGRRDDAHGRESHLAHRGGDAFAARRGHVPRSAEARQGPSRGQRRVRLSNRSLAALTLAIGCRAV